MSRVVVTGAAGFLGSHLSEHLLARGHRVTGVDAFTRFYGRAIKESNLAVLREAPGFELHERNVLAGGLPEVLRGADAVCHLAGRPGVRGGSEERFEAGNVRATEAVVRAAAWAGVPRVVLASSSSVYGPAAGPVTEEAPLEPLSPYGHSKQRAELLAAEHAGRLGIELVSLRYFTVYGPRQRPDMAFARYAAAALRGEPMTLLGDGRQRRDFTYVGDACEATALALERGRAGAVYNVAGGRSVALVEAFALLGAGLGREPAFERRAADAREPRATEADLTRAAVELGWRPQVDLAEGIQSQLAHAADELAGAV
jgi:nucleoside-diphosphate-sugar epimerase